MTPAHQAARQADVASTAPCYRDETVAFDDLFMERWSRSPYVLCHAPRPGYYVLWRELETGCVAMFPLCQACHRRADQPVQLAYAM
jgi:hypothetical protein